MSCMGQNEGNGRIGLNAFSTAILQRGFLTLHSQDRVDINRRATEEKKLKTLLG